MNRNKMKWFFPGKGSEGGGHLSRCQSIAVHLVLISPAHV